MELSTLFLGRKMLALNSVNSTNNYIANHENLSDLPEGTVVMADEQTQGKGQGTNQWISDPGQNIILSVLLRPKFLDPIKQFDLSKAMSLALTDAIRDIASIDCEIKWPNDIFYQGKKLAGILIENSWRADQCQHSIIGIGLNVNQANFKGLPNANSLSNISDKTYDLSRVYERLISAIEGRYLQLKIQTNEEIKIEYKQKLFLRDRKSTYVYKNQHIRALARDVDHQGRLLLEKENGELIACNHDDLYFMLIE